MKLPSYVYTHHDNAPMERGYFSFSLFIHYASEYFCYTHCFRDLVRFNSDIVTMVSRPAYHA